MNTTKCSKHGINHNEKKVAETFVYLYKLLEFTSICVTQSHFFLYERCSISTGFNICLFTILPANCPQNARVVNANRSDFRMS